jgi:thiF family protein
MFAASFEANLALRYLAGLEVEKDLLYYANFFGGELEVRKIKL